MKVRSDSEHHEACKDITVWYALPQSLNDSSVLERFYSWLSPSELHICKSYRFKKDQHTYLIAHALLRAALSRCCDVPPERWQFQSNEYQKPFITEPTNARHLHFNISHTDGMVAIAITRIGPIGVDVEPLSREAIENGVAQEVLSEVEYLDYMQQRDSAKHARFLQYWTLKEAYVKATGRGMTAGLKNHAFNLSDPCNPKIRFLEPGENLDADWDFWQYRLDTGHILALACQSQTTVKPPFYIQEALWLSEIQ